VKEVGFNYGCLSDTLEKQAIEQGFELKDGEKFEKIKKAIAMCGFHVATDSQVNLMLKKLHKQVMANLILLK
jgi:hypothetical protein